MVRSCLKNYGVCEEKCPNNILYVKIYVDEICTCTYLHNMMEAYLNRKEHLPEYSLPVRC